MKKIIASLLIIASMSIYAKEKNADSNIDEKEVTEAIDKAGKKIKTGVDKAGTGIKKFFGKTKEKLNDENKKSTKQKASEVSDKVSNKIKSGAKKAKEKLNDENKEDLKQKKI